MQKIYGTLLKDVYVSSAFHIFLAAENARRTVWRETSRRGMTWTRVTEDSQICLFYAKREGENGEVTSVEECDWMEA